MDRIFSIVLLVPLCPVVEPQKPRLGNRYTPSLKSAAIPVIILRSICLICRHCPDGGQSGDTGCTVGRKSEGYRHVDQHVFGRGLVIACCGVCVLFWVLAHVVSYARSESSRRSGGQAWSVWIPGYVRLIRVQMISVFTMTLLTSTSLCCSEFRPDTISNTRI